MFSRKRRLDYTDIIESTGSVQQMPKPKQMPKINKLLETINPQNEIEEESRIPFQRPNTSNEWLKFHKMNEEGMSKAYNSKEGYYRDSNK